MFFFGYEEEFSYKRKRRIREVVASEAKDQRVKEGHYMIGMGAQRK
jgi:hypothetical protein